MSDRRLLAVGALVIAFSLTTVTGALGGAVVGRVGVVRGSAWLHAVACPPSGSCIAVGYRGNILKRHHPVVVVPISRGGIHGRAVSVPGSDRGFDAATVACPDVDFCLTAFARSGRSRSSEILPIRSGHPGTPIPAPISIHSISCGSPTVCWAFGRDNKSRALRASVLQIVNGRPGALHRLHGLGVLIAGACTSATSCVAAAYNRCRGICPSKVMEIDNGSPGPAAPAISVSAITCPGATECFLAGTGAVRGAVIQSVAAGRPGHDWPVPNSMLETAFACRSAADCYVFYPSHGGNPDQAGAGLYNWVARFNGQRFSGVTSTVPIISAATCLPNDCIGVGTQAIGPTHHILAGVVYRFH